MYWNETKAYRPVIGRPRVLLAVAHPAVGDGIETILRLERRYEVRRVTKLADALRIAPSWPADLALFDAALTPREGRVVLGVPTLVLAGGEAENDAAARRLDDSRGWVAKDAESAYLLAAVERLLTPATQAMAGPLPLTLVGVLVLILAALLLYLVWTAVV
jgi:DNA-binding NarL/FixJ family response regulator